MEETEHRKWESEWAPLFGVSALVGLVIWMSCLFWRQSIDPKAQAISCVAGSLEKACNPSYPWPAANGVWVGLIAFAIALILGRTLIFMVRMESR